MIKQDYAFRRFLTRGKDHARTETLIMAMGYDIPRLHCKIQSNRTKRLLFTKGSVRGMRSQPRRETVQ